MAKSQQKDQERAEAAAKAYRLAVKNSLAIRRTVSQNYVPIVLKIAKRAAKASNASSGE